MILEHNGIWIIKDDSHIGKWVVDSGRLDHDTWLFDKLSEVLPSGGVCFDIGAYIGDHTVWYAKHFDRVLAWEPNPEAFECLRRNTEHIDNVECFNSAVGIDGDAKYSLEWCGSNYGTAQLTEDAGGDISIVQPEDVGNLSFVKIDVEGFEPEVLLALSDTIRKYRPRMLIEQRVGDGNLDAVSSFLDDLNYNYYPIQGKIGKQCDLYCEPNGDREQTCDQPLSE